MSPNRYPLFLKAIVCSLFILSSVVFLKAQVDCPTGIEGVEFPVCSGDTFALDFVLTGGSVDVDVTWMDSTGAEIDPTGLTIDHTDCAPGMVTYSVMGVCLEDTTQVVSDTFQITVVPNDLSPFITTIEEPCNVDVLVDSACVDYITVLGDIPVINPGDSGTVVVDVVHNVLTCDTLSVALNYDCSCPFDSLSVMASDCMDGSFMVTLDVVHDGSGAMFTVTDQDGNDLGTYNYADLPVMVGPFVGDPDLVYTLTVGDVDIPACTASIDVGPINCMPDCNAVTKGPICEGDTLGLMETGGDAVSWLWSSFGDAIISDPTAQNPFATNVANDEIFQVVVTSVNGGVDSCTVMAEVNPLPVCEATNSGPICSMDTLFLDEIGGDASSWQWSTDGAAVISDPTAQNPFATGVSDGETFTVMITDDNGCMSMCSTTATVFPIPVCMAGNDGPICLGDTLNLSENGGDAVSWSWSTDGAAVISDPTAQNPFATGVMDGETFTVMITDANGCMSMCSTTATVLDPPMVEVSNNGPICVGDLLWLQSDVSGGTPPYTYSWSHPNGFTANTADVFISMVTMLDEGPYTLEVKDANGCSAEATTLVEINFNLTDPGLIGADEYFCGPGFDPAPIFEIAPASGAPGVIEYFWMMKEEGDMQWSIIPGAEGPTYNPGPIYVTTQYTRCVRIDGCILALESNVVTKTVGNEAIADPTGPGSPCVDEIETYSVTAQPGATYAWDFGSGATPQFANTSSVDVSWSSFGIRTVTVTVTTQTCTANNILVVNVSDSPVFCADFATPGTGVKDVAYQVFPNPFNNELQVVLDQPVEVRSQLRVANLQGSVVQTDWIAAGNAQTVLDMTTLPSGIYILTIDLGAAGVFHDRIVKR